MSLVERALAKSRELVHKVAMANEMVKAGSGRPWHEVKEPLTPSALASIDGGSRVVEFKGFTLYLVQAVGVRYRMRGGGGYSLEKREWCGEVDIILPPKFVRDRVSLYRELLEAYAARRLCQSGKSEIMLMDGSLASVLIKPRPGSNVQLNVALEALKALTGVSVEHALNLLMEEVLDGGFIAWRRLFEDRVYSNEMQIPQERLAAAVAFLEHVEKLLHYMLLLECCTDTGTKLLFVSKTSRSTEMLNKPFPDMFLLDLAHMNPGYSEPIKLMMHQEKSLPGYLGLDSFFGSVEITATYARLARGGPMLKLEYVGDPKELAEAVSMMMGVAADGYPYPLRSVHEEARISSDVVEQVVSVLNLELEETGREVVEYE